MTGLGWILRALLFLFCAGVSLACLSHLLRRDGRIRSFGEFDRVRLAGFAFFLLPALAGAYFARLSELRCERPDPGGQTVTCTIEQRRLRSSFHRVLPPGGLRGAEVEEGTGRDADGYPERQTRLVLLTDEGPFRLTDFGQLDADKARARLMSFLADPAQRAHAVGQDNRWYLYPPIPMWILIALCALIGRF